MTVPSYDDLTPGIPDVAETGREEQLALFLARASRPNAATPNAQVTPNAATPKGATPKPATSTAWFACLRSPDRPITRSPDSLLAIARDFSPRVRQVSGSEVLLDVSGLGRLIGEPAEIARQLTRAIDDARVKASVALGQTQTIARLLVRAATAHGLTLRHHHHQAHEEHEQKIIGLCDRRDRRGLCAGACDRDTWLQLPLGLLRDLEMLPPAINHRDRDRPYEIFEMWGIATLGDLAALPPGDVSTRLGRRGVALHRLARGLDPAPFVPDAGTPRYVGRLELEWPIDGLEPLSFVFARLLDPLAAALERADRGAAAIRLELRLTDRSTETRVLQLPAAMRDTRVLRTLLLLDLESHPPSPLRGFGETSSVTAAEVMIDAISIELDPAPSRITQFSLLQRALPSPETLSTLTARLSALVGEARVGSPVLLDSHAPDAFVLGRYAPEGAGRAEGAPGADGAGAGGADGAAVLRRCRGSMALHVSVERGRPVHIASSRRGIPYGAIVQAAGPWRTSGGWWLADVSPTPRRVPRRSSGRPEPASKGGEGGWSRNEWDVALHSGAVCRIYQDRTTGHWFLEGVYD